MAALGEKEPEEKGTGEADAHDDVFGEERPLGSVEGPDCHREEEG